jgi:hypothetical protein
MLFLRSAKGAYLCDKELVVLRGESRELIEKCLVHINDMNRIGKR